LPWIKGLILLAVVIGLAIAVRSAMNQWDEQSERVQHQLANLDHQIETASGQSLEDLSAKRAAIDKTVPRLSNLSWPGLSLSLLLYACGLVPSAFVLRSALATMGERPRVSTCVASQLIGHVGKYVPGKAMVIVLRAGGLARDGVRPLTATISIFMETFLMMAVGAALSGAIIFWLPVPAWMTWAAALVAITASIPTFPGVLRRIVAKVASTRGEVVQSSEVDVVQSNRFFFVGWGWSLLSWLLIGISFAVLVASIPSARPLPPMLPLIAIATASIGLAMVVGFASLLPGGAGIRELVLTTLLATSVGPAHALLAAIAARLMYIVVESVVATAAWIWLRRHE
jgi:uncharacterized membrane protein YbhN (UPF0104 family)